MGAPNLDRDYISSGLIAGATIYYDMCFRYCTVNKLFATYLMYIYDYHDYLQPRTYNNIRTIIENHALALSGKFSHNVR